MDIDITELTAYEIQEILSNYPRGKLAVKHGRIFWESGSINPVQRPNEPRGHPQQHPRAPPQGKGQNIANAFEKMSDTLGRMVC